MIDKIVRVASILLLVGLIGYIVVIKMPKASVSGKEVVAEMEAGALLDAFVTDEAHAEQQYIGKVLIVSGVIDDKYEDENGSPVVILKSSEGDPAALVTLETSEKSKLVQYDIDQTIKIKGLCSGMLMEVTLNKGRIVD